MSGFAAGDRPFGGAVRIFGFIPGAPNRTTPAANRPKYGCSVRQVGTLSWQHLNDAFHVTIEEQVGGGFPTFTPGTQTAGVNDDFTYQDAPPVPGIGWRQLFPSHLLAIWDTGSKSGLWEIMVEVVDPVADPGMTSPIAAGIIVCTVDGTTRQNVIIYLDKVAPLTSLAITGEAFHAAAARSSPRWTVRRSRSVT